MKEFDQPTQDIVHRDLIAPAEETSVQTPQFPGETAPPMYEKGVGPVLKGLSIDGEEKEFVQMDHTCFLYNTPESLMFDMNSVEDYERAIALIAHLKVDTGVDIRIGRGVDEAKTSETDTVFREDNLSNMYVDKSVAIIVPMTFAVSSPFFGSGGELPLGDEEWQKNFSEYFEKAQGILPPYPETNQTQN